MEEFKKCPFCAEDIKKDALKCKHCGEFLKNEEKKVEEIKEKVNEKKLDNLGIDWAEMGGYQIKKDLEEKELKREKQNLADKLKDKLKKYPEDLKYTLEDDILFLRKLDNMSDKDIENDIFNIMRIESIKLLLLILLIPFISIFFGLAIFCITILITWFILIWLYPSEDEKDISFKRFISKLQNFKEYKNRTLLTVISILLFIIWIFFVINNNIEEKKEQERIDIKNKLEEQERVKLDEENKIKYAKEEKEKNTFMQANSNLNSTYTSNSTIDINFSIKNIQKITINDETIDTLWKESLTYTFNLALWDNSINIIWYNDEIKRETTINIKRVTVEEDEKIKKEEKRVLDESTKLWISYNQVLKDINSNVKKSSDVDWLPRYMWDVIGQVVTLEIIWDKNNITRADIIIYNPDVYSFNTLALFIRNLFPWEKALTIINDFLDGWDWYVKVYWNKQLKYSKYEVSWIPVSIVSITRAN